MAVPATYLQHPPNLQAWSALTQLTYIGLWLNRLTGTLPQVCRRGWAALGCPRDPATGVQKGLGCPRDPATGVHKERAQCGLGGQLVKGWTMVRTC